MWTPSEVFPCRVAQIEIEGLAEVVDSEIFVPDPGGDN